MELPGIGRAHQAERVPPIRVQVLRELVVQYTIYVQGTILQDVGVVQEVLVML